jgi:hypothetical protein
MVKEKASCSCVDSFSNVRLVSGGDVFMRILIGVVA